MMILYLNGAELRNYPKLRKSMFRDRKKQFIDRLGWQLKVVDQQFEVDEYDRPDATYVVCCNDENEHCGSMRLIPTDTPNMIGDHFSHIIPGITFRTNQIWECTRFCISRNASPDIGVSVLAGAAKFMRSRNLRAFLGVFDARARRTYRRLGACPIVLGSEQAACGSIDVGMWHFDPKVYDNLVKSSRYDLSSLDAMYEQSLGRICERLHSIKTVENA